MTTTTHRVYQIDVQDYVLMGLLQLLKTWQNEDAHSLEPQKWQAVVEHFSDSPILDLFCADSGIDTHIANDWTQGLNLPNSEVCAFYLNLLIQKILAYLEQLRERREDLLHPATDDASQSSLATLPDNEIKAFEPPNGMSHETPLEQVGTYLTLPLRLRNCLYNEGITQVGHVLQPNEDRCWTSHFLRIPNFGKVSTAKLYHFLVEHGFKPILKE